MPLRSDFNAGSRFPLRRIMAISLMLASTLAWSGPYEDGLVARERGDFSTAFSNFKTLASGGDARSQFQLSLLYSTGKGVKPNPKEALYWLQQAATHKDIQAQSNLGVAYNLGRGVAQDPIKAYAWSSMASVSGDSVAATNRDIAAKKLSPTQIERAKALASDCLKGDYRPCL